MAYMVPLPQPLGADGLPLAVPQRHMLYLPPGPDLVRPPEGSGVKERRRDWATRRWQGEVRKARTLSGSVVSLPGVYRASVRGAVYVLSLLQRSELTFLSRLPRRTMRVLALVHPLDDDGDEDDDDDDQGSRGRRVSDERRFGEVKAEFERNRHRAKRDFWIATALLPFATAVDIAIPIFGGFSEVDLVWMVVTGRAWMAARGVVRRLVLAPPGDPEREASSQKMGGQAERGATTGAVYHGQDGEERPARSTGGRGRWSQAPGPTTEPLREDGTSGDGSQRQDRKKQKDQPVEMRFRPSTSMTLLTHYVRAACHKRNAEAFQDVGEAQDEAEVLRSIGWAPEDREVDNKEDDVAWQIRKTSEDLRVVVTKAAKSWDKWCKKYVEDPERVLGGEKGKRLVEDGD